MPGVVVEGLDRLPALRIVCEIQRGASMRLRDDSQALREANRALQAEARQVRLRSRRLSDQREHGTTRRASFSVAHRKADAAG